MLLACQEASSHRAVRFPELDVLWACVFRAAVYSMYVGEGERIVRDVFMRARRAAPAVVLLDEIDGIAARRAVRSRASRPPSAQNALPLFLDADEWDRLRR